MWVLGAAGTTTDTGGSRSYTAPARAPRTDSMCVRRFRRFVRTSAHLSARVGTPWERCELKRSHHGFTGICLQKWPITKGKGAIEV